MMPDQHTPSWELSGDKTRELAAGFFKLGAQYYVAGRAGTIAALLPVAGTLFHHAIELFIKGDLATTHSLKRLKKLAHQLPLLWQAYKEKHSPDTFVAFDPVIEALAPFHGIRYPERILETGMYSTISLTPFTPTYWSADDKPIGQYHLSVPDIDSLVAALFVRARCDPNFWFHYLSDEGKRALYTYNASFVDPRAKAPS